MHWSNCIECTVFIPAKFTIDRLVKTMRNQLNDLAPDPNIIIRVNGFTAKSYYQKLVPQ